MEGPILPGESEGEESSAWPITAWSKRALEVYEARMAAFEASLEEIGRPRRKRRPMSDYRTKNCEEASGERSEA